jgi:integrator complex subunit 12
MELDPVFVRALRLLHSTSKESGMQLKAMLDESIRMKKNPGSAPSKLAVAAPQQSRESHIKDTTDRYCNIS